MCMLARTLTGTHAGTPACRHDLRHPLPTPTGDLIPTRPLSPQPSPARPLLEIASHALMLQIL